MFFYKPSDEILDLFDDKEDLEDRSVHVLMYRLFQYTMKAVLEANFSTDEANKILRASGYISGTALAEKRLDLTLDNSSFMAELTDKLKELKIGILRVEKAEFENNTFVITISEDLDCSGVPITDESVCFFDEGFIEGIFEAYSGDKYHAEEVDCWAMGGRTCRFEVESLD